MLAARQRRPKSPDCQYYVYRNADYSQMKSVWARWDNPSELPHFLPVVLPCEPVTTHRLGASPFSTSSSEVGKSISELVRNSPPFRIPLYSEMESILQKWGGQSLPIEAFNSDRVRILSGVQALMAQLADAPGSPLAVEVPHQVIKLVKAWIAAGTPDDLSIAPEVLLEAGDERPGSVERLAPDVNGDWLLAPFDPERASMLPTGSIYLVEHARPSGTGREAELLVRAATPREIEEHSEKLRADLVQSEMRRIFRKWSLGDDGWTDVDLDGADNDEAERWVRAVIHADIEVNERPRTASSRRC